MSKQTFVKFAIVGFVVGLIVIVAVARAHASYVPPQVCGEGIHTYNPHCEVTPTTIPTVAPTAEPTVEVTPEVTVTPTITPNNRSDGHSDGQHTGPDGLGCAVHDCSQHIIPAGAPATGRAE